MAFLNAIKQEQLDDQQILHVFFLTLPFFPIPINNIIYEYVTLKDKFNQIFSWMQSLLSQQKSLPLSLDDFLIFLNYDPSQGSISELERIHQEVSPVSLQMQDSCFHFTLNFGQSLMERKNKIFTAFSLLPFYFFVVDIHVTQKHSSETSFLRIIVQIKKNQQAYSYSLNRTCAFQN